MSTTLDRQQTSPSADDFAQRLLDAILGAQFVQAAYLGDRLGYYRALAASGPSTSPELAERTGTAERYAREWLEHQAVAGVLTVDDPGAAPQERRFELPAGPAESLTDPVSLAHLGPIARMLAARSGLRLDDIVEACRTGGGVELGSSSGPTPGRARAAINRPMFLHALAKEVLPGVGADLDLRLRAGARVADVGCGEGWSSIGIASGYPTVTVDGYDVDAPSVASARRRTRPPTRSPTA